MEFQGLKFDENLLISMIFSEGKTQRYLTYSSMNA